MSNVGNAEALHIGIRGRLSSEQKKAIGNDSSVLFLASLIAASVMVVCAGIPTPATSVLSLISLVAYFLVLSAYRIDFLLKYLVFVFGVVVNIVGVAVCEFTDTPLTELSVTAHYAGSLPLIVLSRWLFIVVLLWVDLKQSTKYNISAFSNKVAQKSKWISIAAVFAMIIFAIELVDVMRFPSAIASGVSRFGWSRNYSASLLMPQVLTDNTVYLVFISALAVRFGNKKVGIAGTVLFLTYLLWGGVKFGGFFQVFYFYIWAYFDIIIELDSKRLARLVATSLIAVIILAAAAVFIQSFSSSGNWNASEYLFSRTAQQGQLWWKSYDTSQESHMGDFKNEIDAVFFGDPTEENHHIGSSQGMYMIMYYTAPSGIVDTKLATGSSYTEAGYAAMLYYFGPLGPLAFSAALALLIGFLVNSMLKAVIDGRLIDSVLILRLVFLANTLLAAMNWGLFGLVSLASYVFLTLEAMVRRGGRSSRSSLSTPEPNLRKYGSKSTGTAGRRSSSPIDGEWV